MERAHRASVLAASCLSTPVNPQTRAPVTLYEREARGAGAEGAKDNEEDFESESDTASDPNVKECENQDFEGRIHLDKMNRSNKEYYAQLERLKKAHLETMAQLESMYQHKLHLKGVVPQRQQDTCDVGAFRSAWEQSPNKKAQFHRCCAAMDLSSKTPDSSEASEEELTDDHIANQLRVLSPAEEKILKMWNGFSLQDYMESTPRSPRFKREKKRAKEWSPKITVPEPFQMTTREDKKKQHSIKTKSEIEMENNLIKKYLEEEAECQKKFKANPVPASVFLPLYQEIVQRNEERRNFVKERRRELLLASQQPFRFIEREERKKELLREQLAGLPAPKKKTRPFKAKPVPKSIYSTSNDDRIKEEALYRGIKIQMRAHELLQSSAEPKSMLASRAKQSIHKHKCFQTEEFQRKPKINSQVPDFEALHHKFQQQLLKRKDAKPVTVCEPFYLHTLQIPSKKAKILKDIQADEEVLNETRWPYQTPRRKPRIRCFSADLSFCRAMQSEPPRTTESTKRRQQATRDHEKQRMREYFEELGQMESRIDKRPLLLERATQSHARISAEKHFSSVLKEAGLKGDYLLENERPEKSQHHFSDEEFKTTPLGIKSSYLMAPRSSTPCQRDHNGFQAEMTQRRESTKEEKFPDNFVRNDSEYEEDYTSEETCSESDAD